MSNRGFYEFFCGGGMARAGLGERWTCLFANDFDARKGHAYAANWGAEALKIADVASLTLSDLPGAAALAWASFPCQDLSLAGSGAGLDGARSGAFWPFWRLMLELRKERREPRLIVLENVCGALTSHGGKGFVAIAEAIAAAGYRLGALVIDAAHFVPQSRPRLFIVAVRADIAIPPALVTAHANQRWHTPALRNAEARICKSARVAWLWWTLPAPPARNSRLADILEENLEAIAWHTPAQTARLLGIMNPLHQAKLAAARHSGEFRVGAVFRRTRIDENGARRQRAEVRFDDLAGCLRTPAGGSSRQILVILRGGELFSRLLSGREAARLMGLPDDYRLPKRANETLHLIGDGVAAPVVRYLADHLLAPLNAPEAPPGLRAAE
jgi:DNA (cytosine-5)-methyltransferase 1